MSDDSSTWSVPRHIAFIMDGNNRWARANGHSSAAGHKAGMEAIRGVLSACRDQGVRVVTLFAFSSENWSRPGAEVSALMRLFGSYLDSEAQKLHKDGVRLRFIGRRDRFSSALRRKMDYAEQLTRANRETQLVIAADYGGRWDIVEAAQQAALEVQQGAIEPSAITEEWLDRKLSTGDLPPPDLCVRSAGEQRISNFLLWQIAYSELYFSELYWPDFDADEVARIIAAYADRERRFGGRPGAELPDSNEEAKHA